MPKLQDSADKLGKLGLVWLQGPEDTVVEIHLTTEGIVPQLHYQACEELEQVRVGRQVLEPFYTAPNEADPLAYGKPMQAVCSGHDVFLERLVWKLLVECPRAEISQESLCKAVVGLGLVDEAADFSAENVSAALSVFQTPPRSKLECLLLDGEMHELQALVDNFYDGAANAEKVDIGDNDGSCA